MLVFCQIKGVRPTHLIKNHVKCVGLTPKGLKDAGYQNLTRPVSI